MPKPYELRYLPLFWDDLNEAVSYIADHLKNPQAAERLVDNVEDAILQYQKNPLLGHEYRSTREHAEQYRWFAFDNYLIFYVVLGDVMEVRRLIYGARDLTRLVL